MKLNWLRAGCASIAENQGLTFMVDRWDRGDRLIPWSWAVRTSGGTEKSVGWETTREAAEAACEKWLDEHDKPEWVEHRPWLWSCEWRGVSALVAESIGGNCFGKAHTKTWSWWSQFGTMEFVKAEVEAEIRERTGGAQCE